MEENKLFYAMIHVLHCAHDDSKKLGGDDLHPGSKDLVYFDRHGLSGINAGAYIVQCSQTKFVSFKS